MRNTGAMAEQLAHKQTANIKATMKSSITNAQLKDRKTSLLQRSRLHYAQFLTTRYFTPQQLDWIHSI